MNHHIAQLVCLENILLIGNRDAFAHMRKNLIPHQFQIARQNLENTGSN